MTRKASEGACVLDPPPDSDVDGLMKDQAPVHLESFPGDANSIQACKPLCAGMGFYHVY